MGERQDRGGHVESGAPDEPDGRNRRGTDLQSAGGGIRGRDIPGHDLSGDDVSGRDDDALVGLVADGNRAAFAELFRRHQAFVWRVAVVATGGEERAAAVAVEGFVRTVAAIAWTGAPTGVAFRTRLAVSIRRAARTSPRLGAPSTEPEILDSAEQVEPALDLDVLAVEGVAEAAAGDLLEWLPTVVPPPPPELWALAEVTWDDLGGVTRSAPSAQRG